MVSGGSPRLSLSVAAKTPGESGIGTTPSFAGPSPLSGRLWISSVSGGGRGARGEGVGVMGVMGSTNATQTLSPAATACLGSSVVWFCPIVGEMAGADGHPDERPLCVDLRVGEAARVMLRKEANWWVISWEASCNTLIPLGFWGDASWLAFGSPVACVGLCALRSRCVG